MIHFWAQTIGTAAQRALTLASICTQLNSGMDHSEAQYRSGDGLLASSYPRSRLFSPLLVFSPVDIDGVLLPGRLLHFHQVRIQK